MSYAVSTQLLAALHVIAQAPEALFLPLGAAAGGVGTWLRLTHRPVPPGDSVETALMAAAFSL